MNHKNSVKNKRPIVYICPLIIKKKILQGGQPLLYFSFNFFPYKGGLVSFTKRNMY